jgi:hypothetical protein
VVRAGQREAVVDRVTAFTMSALLLAGAMTALPSGPRGVVVRAGCRLLTIGLGACAASPFDTPGSQLGLPRCAALAALDQVLPEVLVSDVELDDGATLRRQVTRDGTVLLSVPAGDVGDVGDVAGSTAQDVDPVPVPLWSGGAREQVRVLDGVRLQSGVRWDLPRGLGERELLQSLKDQHDRVVQRRSALSLGIGAPSARERPAAPTTLFSTVDPLEVTWPGSSPVPVRIPRPGTVQVVAGEPVHLLTDRLRERTWTTLAVSGATAREEAVEGSVRFAREADGRVSALSFVLVSAGSLSARLGSRSADLVDVSYTWLPLTTAVEDEIVQDWLGAAAPATLPLSVLTQAAPAAAGNRMQALLVTGSRTTITTLTGEPDVVAAQVRQDVAAGVRSPRTTAAPLTGVVSLAASPGGRPRQLVEEPTCLS